MSKTINFIVFPLTETNNAKNNDGARRANFYQFKGHTLKVYKNGNLLTANTRKFFGMLDNPRVPKKAFPLSNGSSIEHLRLDVSPPFNVSIDGKKKVAVISLEKTD